MYHVVTGAYRVALHLEGAREVSAIAYRAQRVHTLDETVGSNTRPVAHDLPSFFS